MKKWFRHSMEWKAGASLSYTAAVLIYAVVSLLLGEKNVSITVLFELLALCLAGSLLQYVAFTDAVIKKMRYSLRMVVFTLPFLALMTLCAVIFDWFPKGEPFAWVTFSVHFRALHWPDLRRGLKSITARRAGVTTDCWGNTAPKGSGKRGNSGGRVECAGHEF